MLIASVADLVVRPARQPLRDAAAYVRANATSPGPRVVVGIAHHVVSVYGQGLDLHLSPFHGRDTLAADLDRVQPEWVIMLYPRSVDARALETLEERGYRVVETLPGWVDWGGGEVDIWH